MKPFDGNARKLTIPFLLLSGAGWIMFVVAFGWLNSGAYDEGTALEISEDDDLNRAHERWFPFWAFAVATPVLYILAFLHLLTGQWYIGFFSHILTALFLVSGGGILFWDGHTIGAINDIGDDFLFQITDFEEGRLIVVEFTGCLVAVVFMTVAMAIWPFFTDVNSYECIGYQRRDPLTTVRAPAPQPHTYVTVPGQAIPMQPVVFAQQQVYPQGGVYSAPMPNVPEDKTRLVSE